MFCRYYHTYQKQHICIALIQTPKYFCQALPCLLKNFFWNPLFFFSNNYSILRPPRGFWFLKELERSPVIIRFHFRLRRKQKMGKIGPPLCCLSYFWNLLLSKAGIAWSTFKLWKRSQPDQLFGTLALKVEII